MFSLNLAVGSLTMWIFMTFGLGLLDFSDPVGTLGLIFSAVILFELVRMLDADDMMGHLGDRFKFYSGLIGKVGAGLGVVGSGVLRILGLFSGKKKKRTRKKKTQEKDIYQMEEEEDPFEGEGGIDG